MSRVPGCVATVYILATTKIQTTPTTINNDGSNQDYDPVVQLYGNSDSMVSRGLLCVLRDYLKTISREQVMALDPTSIADILGIRPALSIGRNDGLSNMVTLIQNQLRVATDEGEENEQNSNSNSMDSTRLDDISTQNNIQHIQQTTTTPISSPSTLSVETIRGLELAVATKKPTVALLLSGGVDSSVALHLLLQKGYHVVPFYLKIWLEDEFAHLGQCPWDEDVTTCRAVCDHAGTGVHLEIVSLQDEYHQRVMQHTLNEAALGRTPNPDILCNSRVKFGCFLDYLDAMTTHRFDYIASGHYAQVLRSSSSNSVQANNDPSSPTPIARLYRAPDPVKDQSYFLCTLGQSQLQKLVFPIGHLEKSEVRKLADDLQLPNRYRPDSQGLCFLGKVKFRDFMQLHLGESPGDIVNAFTGEVIGTHQGVWYHTVGQRKGVRQLVVVIQTSFL
jgi:tRNA (5-methylaminomethyl-2-thiouridylate)-methyltransferase